MTMNNPKKKGQICKTERLTVIEMIDASIELSQKLGKHPLAAGCNCIICVNKRKNILISKWPEQKSLLKFSL